MSRPSIVAHRPSEKKNPSYREAAISVTPQKVRETPWQVIAVLRLMSLPFRAVLACLVWVTWPVITLTVQGWHWAERADAEKRLHWCGRAQEHENDRFGKWYVKHEKVPSAYERFFAWLWR